MADLEVACGVVVVVVVVGVELETEVPSDEDEEVAWPVDELAVEPDDETVVDLAEVVVAPGCSFATTTPRIPADAAVAMTADWVMRRKRRRARFLPSGELGWMGWFTMTSLRGDAFMESARLIPRPRASCASDVKKYRCPHSSSRAAAAGVAPAFTAGRASSYVEMVIADIFTEFRMRLG